MKLPRVSIAGMMAAVAVVALGPCTFSILA
jgi:hypothetical protein